MRLNEVKKLAELASKLDAAGRHKEADKIDKLLKEAVMLEGPGGYGGSDLGEYSPDTSYETQHGIDVPKIDAVVDLVKDLFGIEDGNLVQFEVKQMIDRIKNPVEPSDTPTRFPEEDEFVAERESLEAGDVSWEKS